MSLLLQTDDDLGLAAGTLDDVLNENGSGVFDANLDSRLHRSHQLKLRKVEFGNEKNA